MPIRLMRVLTAGSVVVFALMTSGCGPKAKPTGQLQGTVTFDGKPVEKATVQIQSPSTGESFAAPVGSGGSYKFSQSVTTGEYLVSIVPKMEIIEAGGKAPPKMPADRTDVPAKYRTAKQSGLKTDVKAGDNTFDVKMTK